MENNAVCCNVVVAKPLSKNMPPSLLGDDFCVFIYSFNAEIPRLPHVEVAIFRFTDNRNR
ncbi:hypothetical protein Fmac_030959 [Flemingia macrophylla]|uniref:Uncharacterized protein n=1 Tax=Flemingia macrophylla TaxID=520843 RepID=A0ABD1L0Q6_9FABA